MSGIGQTIVQGMAFGTGSAIAHRAVGAVAGSMSGGGDDRAVEGAPVNASVSSGDAARPEESCELPTTKFYDCLESHNGNIGDCQLFFDLMQQCQKDLEMRSQYN